MKLNNELLRFASPSAEGLVRHDMARAAALKADLAMLEGTGGTQIKGLITYSGITTHAASTAGANGDTFTPADVTLMDSKLPDAVDAPTAWVLRKAMYAAILNRRADAVTASDGRGPFLLRGAEQGPMPPAGELYGTRVVRSSQVSNTRVKGAGTNLTYILLGYFPDWRVRGPPPRRKFLHFQPLAAFHTLHTSHISAWFPPHSVHDSVQLSHRE